MLKASGKPHIIRVPLIPEITDTEENLSEISALVGDSPVELLTYNPFAGAKYPGVGREYTLSCSENRKIDVSVFQNAVMRE